MNQIELIKLKLKSSPLHRYLNSAPLTSQVEALACPIERALNVSESERTHNRNNCRNKVTFSLPPGHTEKDSISKPGVIEWKSRRRRIPRSRSDESIWHRARQRLASKQAIQKTKSANRAGKSEADSRIAMMSEAELKQGVLDGSIASAAWDTACTSNAGMIGDPYLQTSEPSTKVFAVADGHRTPGANIAKLHHPVREPARTVDMVPALADQSLLSGV